MRTRVFLPLCLFAACAVAQSTPPAQVPGRAADPEEAPTEAPAEPSPAEMRDDPVEAERDPETRRRTPGRDAGRFGGLVSNAATRVYPLMNVDIVDSRGMKTQLVAFHRISGENVFQGYLGAATIEVPYSRVAELRVATPSAPGGRMRADFVLTSGKKVRATFDEREGEQLFAGYATFGRVTIYWRDLRKLRFTARTRTTDLPKYGVATSGVDVRLTDREGVTTELVAFRQATGDNSVQGLRGATRVDVPLRIVRRIGFRRGVGQPLLLGDLKLRDKKSLTLRFPRYAEEPVYRGRAEFGDLRIRLGEIRELVVHRSTPALRDLDPVAAAEGREVEIGDSKKR